MMVESDSTLSILTALLVISTTAVASATFLVWWSTRSVASATKSVVNATKEMSRTTIKPRPSIIHHLKVGEDETHHHYQFILKNQGLGDAFDVRIEVRSRDGLSSQLPPPIPRLRRGQGLGLKFTNIDRSKYLVKIKIDYKDLMDNPYSDEIEYDIGNDVFYPDELREG